MSRFVFVCSSKAQKRKPKSPSPPHRRLNEAGIKLAEQKRTNWFKGKLEFETKKNVSLPIDIRKKKCRFEANFHLLVNWLSVSNWIQMRSRKFTSLTQNDSCQKPKPLKQFTSFSICNQYVKRNGGILGKAEKLARPPLPAFRFGENLFWLLQSASEFNWCACNF